MSEVKQIPVIYCDKELRGNGIVSRRVVEIFDLDGTLIAEKDTYSYTLEEVAKVFNNDGSISITWAGVRQQLMELREPAKP